MILKNLSEIILSFRKYYDLVNYSFLFVLFKCSGKLFYRFHQLYRMVTGWKMS